MARIGTVRIGISGWTYPPWRGVFYPKGLPQKRELDYAAGQFRTLEINGTFYGMQRPDAFGSWADRAPDDFVFAVKGPRFITKPGPVLLARSAKVPMAVFHIAIDRKWTLNTWDRLLVPKPFSRALMRVGSLIPVPEDIGTEDLERYNALLQSLNALGKLENLSVRRDDRPNAQIDEKNAPADISIQVYSQGNLVAEGSGLPATLRRTIEQGASALMWSVRMIGVALAFLAPWVIALAAAIGIVRGIRRSRRHRRGIFGFNPLQ